MLVEVQSLNDHIEISSCSGMEIHEIEASKSKIGLIRSPNHPVMPYNPERKFGLRLKDYMDHYVNDSVFILDSPNRRILIGRDWPGNVMIYYWFGKSPQGMKFIACDSIIDISKRIDEFKFSNKGISQYLRHRKYYQSYTAIEGVKIIQPGFCLEFDFSTGKVSFDSWYDFHSNVLIQSPTRAVFAVRDAVDASLGRLVSKDDKIALMFSGGSDSSLLLDRLISLGYRNVSLYNVAIKGRNSERDRAARTAGFYGYKVNQLDVEQDEAVRNWIDAIEISYLGKAYARINGWLSVLPSLYKHLAEEYLNQRVNVMWGFVHPFMLNSFRFSRAPFIYLTYVLIRCVRTFIKRHPEIALSFLQVVLGKIVFLETENYTHEENIAFKNTMFKIIDQSHHPDELINMKLIMGLVNQKVWTMNRQRTIADEYCPQARNVFPFVDRRLQETAASISLRARYGGFVKWANASNISCKYLTLNAPKKKIPPEYILGGNYESRPDLQSLYKKESFYIAIESIIADIKSDRRLFEILKENSVILPGTWDDLKNMRYSDIETMMSVLMLEKCFSGEKQSERQ